MTVPLRMPGTLQQCGHVSLPEARSEQLLVYLRVPLPRMGSSTGPEPLVCTQDTLHPHSSGPRKRPVEIDGEPDRMLASVHSQERQGLALEELDLQHTVAEVLKGIEVEGFMDFPEHLWQELERKSILHGLPFFRRRTSAPGRVRQCPFGVKGVPTDKPVAGPVVPWLAGVLSAVQQAQDKVFRAQGPGTHRMLCSLERAQESIVASVWCEQVQDAVVVNGAVDPIPRLTL
mmetsp:Transcript_7986/g.22673  ORF Transcript_7986/g.22673 Transcript_7986/m.22673 type:complete len:231 (-) Transcript_7986:313-1005(-)